MRCRSLLVAAFSMVAGMMAAGQAFAQDDSTPGTPVIEAPTIHNIGIEWVVTGDDNVTARVAVHYRKSGASTWQTAMDLWRTVPGDDMLNIEPGQVLFAGSIFNLAGGTAYDIKLTVTDPDGTNGDPDTTSVEQILSATTRSEPHVARAHMRVRYVTPGNGGGSGTLTDPFRGLPAADAGAAPGDLFLLQAGTYSGTATFTASGLPSQPIVWMGPSKGTALLDGQGAQNAIVAESVADVWFEGLEIINATTGASANNSQYLVFKRNVFTMVDQGVVADTGAVTGIYVGDNFFYGPVPWLSESVGTTAVRITGDASIVCNNRILNWDFGIGNTESKNDQDYYNNDISEIAIAGIDCEQSAQNVRCYSNRLTNVFYGINMNSVHGGPLYLFRNAAFNVVDHPFLATADTRGILILNNTTVRSYDVIPGPMFIYADPTLPPEFRFTLTNALVSNNLFVGGQTFSALSLTCNLLWVNFDYNAYSDTSFRTFANWQDQVYANLFDFQVATEQELHGVVLRSKSSDSIFASGTKAPTDSTTQYPLKLNRLVPSKRALINKGQFYDGVNDGFRGSAPDIGAYEVGQPFPVYGPRPVPQPTTVIRRR